MKCLQIASGSIYTDENGTWHPIHDLKIQALESVIEEAAGMPVLVAYHFKSDLERLLKAFPKGRHLDKDPQTIHDWNAGKIPVLFAHPASAGHGLNLQDGGNIPCSFLTGGIWNSTNKLSNVLDQHAKRKRAMTALFISITSLQKTRWMKSLWSAVSLNEKYKIY